MSTVTLVMAGHEFIVSGAGLRVEVVELAGKRVIHTDSQAKASTDNGATGEPIELAADSVTGDASRPSAGGGTGEDDGRDVEAIGGAASVVTIHESEPLAPPPAGDREAGSELLPASGHPNIGPAESAVPGGEPSVPTEDERRAGPSRDAGHNRQSSEAVTNSKPRKPLRPHCQRPTLCGGYGEKHCGTCLKQAGIAA